MAPTEGEGEDVATITVSRSDESQRALPSFLEVTCKNTGKVWRFAAGTESGFAVHVINHKLDDGSPPALYVESVKEGEEPVVFGRNAALVNYGKGWKLQTVIGQGNEQRRSSQVTLRKRSVDTQESDLEPASDAGKMSILAPLAYIGKILLVFMFLFILAGIFTYFLESLPQLIEFFSDLS